MPVGFATFTVSHSAKSGGFRKAKPENRPDGPQNQCAFAVRGMSMPGVAGPRYACRWPRKKEPLRLGTYRQVGGGGEGGSRLRRLHRGPKGLSARFREDRDGDGLYGRHHVRIVANGHTLRSAMSIDGGLAVTRISGRDLSALHCSG